VRGEKGGAAGVVMRCVDVAMGFGGGELSGRIFWLLEHQAGARCPRDEATDAAPSDESEGKEREG
jgi:hypothetical protein